MSYHIAILFHESDSPRTLAGYAITAMADAWRRAGHTVTHLFGIRTFTPADLIVVHVDLSVVPDDYIAFAAQYPIAVNGGVRDIRKSTFARNLLRPGDAYAGPVFVKSNLNYAGIPESNRFWRYPLLQSAVRQYVVPGLRALQRTFCRGAFAAPSDYLVLDNLQQVPEKWFKRDDLVVQTFCPEFENGLYHVRFYQFMGDRHTCVRFGSPLPVVNVHSAVSFDRVEVHPDIETRRRELKFDYGKFDYVIHQGVPVLLDVNKTTGTSRNVRPEVRAMNQYRAEGLYSFFR
jgi:hypothetical protein